MVEKIGTVKNPLTVISIFAGIAEISGTLVLPFISSGNQYLYIWFLMGFPLLLVLLFFGTLNFNNKVLYSPIFTSGSTGEPKGVVITAGAFRAYIDWTRRFFSAYKGAKRLLLTSELTFDITMGDIAFALAFGTDIGVAQHNTNIPSVLAMIMSYRIDVLYSWPTTFLELDAQCKLVPIGTCFDPLDHVLRLEDGFEQLAMKVAA